jgi:hypothetical protein
MSGKLAMEIECFHGAMFSPSGAGVQLGQYKSREEALREFKKRSESDQVVMTEATGWFSRLRGRCELTSTPWIGPFETEAEAYDWPNQHICIDPWPDCRGPSCTRRCTTVVIRAFSRARNGRKSASTSAARRRLEAACRAQAWRGYSCARGGSGDPTSLVRAWIGPSGSREAAVENAHIACRFLE